MHQFSSDSVLASDHHKDFDILRIRIHLRIEIRLAKLLGESRLEGKTIHEAA